MWRNKKLILTAMLAIVIVAGTIGGVALAQDTNGDENQCADQYGALLDKVVAIYEENTGVAINQEQLRNAFTQAQMEMQNEALQNRLQGLVDEGMMTQGEADQYLEWWQSRPDVTLPDVPLAGPLGRGFGGHSFHGGMFR